LGRFVDTGKARLQYRHFPAGGPGSPSFRAAEATECAAERGKFWNYGGTLLTSYRAGQELKNADLERIAVELGLNKEIFGECLSIQRYAFAIDKERAQGKDLGVTAAPAIFVNGVLQSDWRSFEALAAAIEGAASGPSR
jgi:protein-disulfide isomerase